MSDLKSLFIYIDDFTWEIVSCHNLTFCCNVTNTDREFKIFTRPLPGYEHLSGYIANGSILQTIGNRQFPQDRLRSLHANLTWILDALLYSTRYSLVYEVKQEIVQQLNGIEATLNIPRRTPGFKQIFFRYRAYCESLKPEFERILNSTEPTDQIDPE